MMIIYKPQGMTISETGAECMLPRLICLITAPLIRYRSLREDGACPPPGVGWLFTSVPLAPVGHLKERAGRYCK